MKSAFLPSKGLLCLYDKQNNTWLLVDMEFLFSCSTRHLTHSLRSLVSYRVKHSKRNSISTRAHVLFPIYAVQQHLKINAGIIKMVCEPLNKCKTGTSSKDGCKYEFKCIGKDNIPTNCDIIKSSDVSKGLTNDEKIMNQKKS